ncbi:aminomethyl-transferring glycine dehydrogenase subunit GcvPB [Athalassotoga saccharophila]|uniref:aminomethyl-transferring glycine dehydrogenase subunit GcvPB n=1 Tax=Athalassotoga saccharophila TaxID=1441386 RepID=UPI0013798237|nr:aminomethyl-transferring glycine dehydrogenase subunit GcvPB [Athalassotoga saccharophila]BBJ28250.1 putative glycine dehydrogenase (decarboxylating) subunit 2 [Athalassotoga saccharophila]
MELIFEISTAGRRGFIPPKSDVKGYELSDKFKRSNPPRLPEVTEGDVVRHYTNLSRLNYAVDVGFYPLGSCTMKYNPKLNEYAASFDGFSKIHPYQDESSIQGALELMYNLQEDLKVISGMDAMTLQPAAGAHGEFAGIAIIRAYHRFRKDFKRDEMIIPDSAHGTNPATATMNGYKAIEIKSDKDGMVDIDELKKMVSDRTAGIMLTNPNTLGLFDERILEIAEIVHNAGGLLYYDGANLNAIMGKVRPGDLGFDVVHFNLHKTFSTPHGMGGPGAGPIGVKKFLEPFLPVPTVSKKGEKYFFDYSHKHSIGRVRSFYGNFSVLVKAYAYILTMGGDGLKRASEMAVLNANYLKARISKILKVPYDTKPCMHEFVATTEPLLDHGVKALDFVKRMLDYGVHPPTVYFPLIVHEDLMIEPTETESKKTLDKFVEVIDKITKEAKENPKLLLEAPHVTPVRRLDDVRAAKQLVLRWK